MHKNLIFVLITVIFVVSNISTVAAQDSSGTHNIQNGKQHAQEFIDENGDGYNDNSSGP